MTSGRRIYINSHPELIGDYIDVTVEVFNFLGMNASAHHSVLRLNEDRLRVKMSPQVLKIKNYENAVVRGNTKVFFLFILLRFFLKNHDTPFVFPFVPCET